MSAARESKPEPYALWLQADGDTEKYRALMIEHGHLTPKDGDGIRVCQDCDTRADHLMTDGSWICHQCGAVS